MFGPLSFKEQQKNIIYDVKSTQCPMCSDTFSVNNNVDVFLKHLFEVHDLVIEDAQNIPKLESYVEYWRKRFSTCEMSSIIPSINIEIPTEVPNKKKYFLISTLMKEDKDLRQRLRLEFAIELQETERSDDSFTRNCLFCRLEFVGFRKHFIEHLSDQHNLQLGNSQNLVYIDELLDLIEHKLNSFQCIYCEKIFPDRTVLKEHMRKKIHKRINPSNHSYDKFYIVNYTGNEDNDEPIAIEPGERRNSDSEYSDWKESDTLINCLFCEYSETNVNKLCLHMQSSHRFNFPQLAAHLDFYQRLKLVNFLRKQVHFHKCPTCDLECANSDHLVTHMKEVGCFVLPSLDKFDQPEYYFPTYEDDAFLYYLEEIED